MRFTQLDKVTEVVSGQHLTAVKCLSLAEEYLQDHFPRFPIMPGVLMLEALFQAGMWLVRVTENFEHSMVVLREARNVKFQDFVRPGDQMVVEARLKKLDGASATIHASGSIQRGNCVSGRLVLERYNLAEQGLGSPLLDQTLRRDFQRFWRRLAGGAGPPPPPGNKPLESKRLRESETVPLKS